jgi:hypothetical protein
VGRLEQRNTKRVFPQVLAEIIAARAKLDAIFLPAYFDLLAGQPGRDKPGLGRLGFRRALWHDLDHGIRQIARVHGLRLGQFHDCRFRARALRGGRCVFVHHRSALADLTIDAVIRDAHFEGVWLGRQGQRQLRPGAVHHLLGNRHHLLFSAIHVSREDEFMLLRILRVVLRLAFGQQQVALHLLLVRHELAEEHHHDPRMREVNADFSPGPLESFDVRRDEVHEQHHPEQITAGQENREVISEERNAPDKPLLKITLLRDVKAFIRLRDRADPDKDEAERQAGDGEAKRREKFPNMFHGVLWANRTKASRAAFTAGASPIIL